MSNRCVWNSLPIVLLLNQSLLLRLNILLELLLYPHFKAMPFSITLSLSNYYVVSIFICYYLYWTVDVTLAAAYTL